MSRLEDESIVSVGRNRSGIDAGEIDYTINMYKFHGQGKESLKEIIKYLNRLKQKCAGRIEELEACDHKYKLVSGDKPLPVYECQKCFYRSVGPMERGET